MSWKIAKVSTYIGAILVTIYAAMLGLLHMSPPRIIFDTGIVFVVIGVVVGNYFVLSKRPGRKKD